MSVTGIRTHADGGAEPPPDARPDRHPEPGEQPTEQLIAAVGDRCVACEAPLVSDQRYCLNCGQRRGKAEHGFQAYLNPPAPPPTPAVRARPHASPGATLVAGIATLLLAMGVGVLIGHNGASTNSRPAVAATPQVITVNGGGGGGNTAASTQGRHAKARKAGTATIKSPKIVITKKVAQAATAAAGKVLGSSANLAPPTVAVGGSCNHGAGCQGGKFTGNFFGGG